MESVNISNIRNCYGCGVCAIACPKKIIKIELNREGFYEPDLFDEGTCTQCGICLDVCAYNHDELLDSNAKDADSYAAWSDDMKVRLKCTSGGLSFELGTYLIKQGYKACGVKYNPDLNRAEHFMATTKEEFIPSIGSKYIPSYTLPGFSQLNRKDKFFVTGTPCQIDSIRRYIRKLKIEENFVLMDFFCHGVPSVNMWNKYIEGVVKQIGKITSVSWRNKVTTWHESCVIAVNLEGGEKKIDWHHSFEMVGKSTGDLMYLSFLKDGDLFYEFFLSDVCLGRACYDKCKYKYEKSSADIRIGDLWGKKYKNVKEGVSGLLVLTEKGKDIVSHLDSCTLIKEDLAVVAEVQQKVSPGKKYVRKYLLKAFTSNLSMKAIYRLYKIYLLQGRVINKLLRLIQFKS